MVCPAGTLTSSKCILGPQTFFSKEVSRSNPSEAEQFFDRRRAGFALLLYVISTAGDVKSGFFAYNNISLQNQWK